MPLLDLDAFRAAPLCRDPFDFVVVPGFLRAEARAAVTADFPAIDRPGSFPVRSLRGGPRFDALVAELQSAALTAEVAEKFGVDLAGRPTMVTVRGRVAARDGAIHTDSETKIVTALLYLTDRWDAAGGRLRILRSAEDIDDYAVEVPPDGGTLLVFRRSDRSWHGHLPFEGIRRSVQLNWLTSAAVLRREQARHRVSAAMKRLVSYR